jgi:hypothetical protein
MHVQSIGTPHGNQQLLEQSELQKLGGKIACNCFTIITLAKASAFGFP